jgi:hypothetical protein
MAVLSWFEKDRAGIDREAKVADCENWLQKVAGWESYVLDSRIGLKITTAQDTIRRYKERTDVKTE